MSLSFFEIAGDTVVVQVNGAANDKWYQGHVHFVREAEVALRFHGSFPKHGSVQCDVRFQVNRLPLRRQHQALCTNQYAPQLLFPQKTHVAASTTTPSEPSVTFYDPKIANNPRQVQAIKHILALPSTSHPFIIFGP
jgi:helicase MOV-10